MAQTPTIQDILASYQEGVGAGGTNTALLLQALRNRQSMAQEEDAQFASNIQSGGKAGLNIYKARKDFLLAKRANPNLKFADFMSDPKTSAKYMTQGTDAIVTGESPAIGLKETLNPFSREYARNLNVESTQASPEYQALRSNTNQAIPSAQSGLLPDQTLNAMPDFDNYSNLPNPAPYVPPPPLGDVSNAGPAGLLPRNQNNFIEQALGGVRPSSEAPVLGARTGNSLLQGAQRIDGNQASQNVIKEAMDAARLRLGAQTTAQAIPSQVPVETGASAGVMGTAGKALGAVGGAYNLGTGLRDISKGKGDLSTVSKTASGGAGLLAALGVINPMWGLGLGALSMLSKRK